MSALLRVEALIWNCDTQT